MARTTGWLLRGVAAVAIAGLTLSVAVAAEGDGAGEAGAAEPGGVELQFEQAMEIPDSDKLSQAEGKLKEMRAVLRRVLAILEEARKDKDVVKLNCVNEKLTAVKGLLRISEQANVALQEAVAKGESESAAHEFTKIAISAQKVSQLRAEAEGCVGELAKYAGDTELAVETPEELEELPDRTRRQPPPGPPDSPAGTEDEDDAGQDEGGDDAGGAGGSSSPPPPPQFPSPYNG